LANSKKEKAVMLDPNRFRIAQNNSYAPGMPMNNNPMNVTSIDPQTSSLSGVNQFPYGDSGLASPSQMGGVFPYPASGLPEANPIGTVYNARPYNTLPTPDPKTASMMPGAYQFEDAKARGLYPSALGPTGMPGVVPPGGAPMGQADMLQNSMTMPLQGMQSAELAVGGMNTKSGKRGSSKKEGKA